MLRIVSFVVSSVVVFSTAALGAGDAKKGKALYAVCVMCHGNNGEGKKAMNAPKIAGQDEWYLKNSLLSFLKKDGRGSSPGDVTGAQMRAMAGSLKNEAGVDDVIAHILTLPAK